MTISVKHFAVALAATLILLSIGLTPAKAHGFIVRAVPEDRAILDRPPTRLQYWFSEGLEIEFSSVNVRDSNGQIIATGGVDPENTSIMRVQLPPTLPEGGYNGAYIVELRPAFASDGHVYAETRVFFIGDSAGTQTGETLTSGALPLEVLWRTVIYAAVMLVFGATVLYAGVLVPAWGNKAYPAGLLPPRVMERLNWIVGIGLMLAIGGNIVALLQQSMAFFNVGLGEVFSQNLWSVVRIGSRFGDVWNFRMAMLLFAAGLFAASVYYRQQQPQTVRAFWTANGWVMALVVGSFSVVSHAAGSLMLPWIGIGVDWLHGTGVGFWVGGLAALVLTLPAALEPYSTEQKRQALLAALRRYSRFALGAALIVITTGIYSALAWIYTPYELTETTFGGSLLVKIALVAGLLVLGAVHYVALHPQRFARWARHAPPLQLMFTLRLEVVFALLVLGAAGLLTATPVPIPDFAQNQTPAPRATQIIGDYTVTQSITPGGPGSNTYDTSVISANGESVEGLTVVIQHVFPALDLRSDFQTTDPVPGGVYVAADGVIDRVGEWWTLVDLHRPDGTTQRAAFRWDIRADAAVIQSQPPGVQNLLALGAILVVLGWVASPTVQRLIRLLDLSPASVTIASGATVATVLLLGFGFLFLEDSSRQYQERITPPPAVVNLVLPDAASLAQGRALYMAHCASWETLPDGLDLLRARLPDARDAEVFQITQAGFRGLPPCDATLSEEERWNLVNYLRTFVRHTFSR